MTFRESAGRGKGNENIFRWSMAPKPRSIMELEIKREPIEDYYKIFWKDVVGEGVSGEVCQCESIETGKRYVLKSLLKCEYSLREVQLHFYASKSENVVQIQDVFECFLLVSKVPGSSKVMCYAVVMEYMEGGDLYEFISAKGSFTEAEAAFIIRQITEALFHLHSLNLAHRDLKPENTLANITAANLSKDKFFSDLVVKITDFGYAKEDDHKMKSPLYTPYYVPPEVIINDAFWPGSEVHFYDKSCDMWSLGVIIYIILCGYPPFYPENDEDITSEMVEKIKLGHYNFPDEDWKNISFEAKDLIRKLLVVDSNKRWTSVEVITHPWLNIQNHNTSPLSTSKNVTKMRSMSANQTYSDLREQMREVRTRPKTVIGPIMEFNDADNSLLKKRVTN